MANEKDRRLYARFDIGFDEHDKVFPLSDAAFRALVEATLYSRRQLTDGFLAERLAVKRWGADVLEELSTNDPEKPSLIRVSDGWMIHDFAEHQTTNADIEAKRAAGRKGAASRWQGKGMAPAMAPAMGDPMRNDATTLAKTETDTDTDTTVSKETVTRRARGARVEAGWVPDQSLIEQMQDECPGLNLEAEHRVFIDYWIAQPGQKGVKLDWPATWRNWMRRKYQDRGGGGAVVSRLPVGKPSAGDRARAIADEFRKEGL